VGEQIEANPYEFVSQKSWEELNRLQKLEGFEEVLDDIEGF